MTVIVIGELVYSRDSTSLRFVPRGSILFGLGPQFGSDKLRSWSLLLVSLLQDNEVPTVNSVPYLWTWWRRGRGRYGWSRGVTSL